MKKFFPLLLKSTFGLICSMPMMSASENDGFLYGVTAKASSSVQDAHSAENMVGVLQARWIAGRGEEQWLQFEFEEPTLVQSVRINWENAFASDYQVELQSPTGQWQQIFKALDLKKINRAPIILKQGVLSKSLRINMYKKATQHAYSIYDVKVNGKRFYEKVIEIKDRTFMDSSLSPEERADLVLNQMTFKEKRAYTTGFNNFFIAPLKRFGLRSIYMTDASAGLHIRRGMFDMEKSVAYPATVALAASWNSALAHRYGGSIGAECRALGTDILLGPGLNLYRNSMCGRSFEYMGEDPLLVGVMATEYVKGMQEKKVMSTGKHFIVNNHEWLRHYSDIHVDERTMKEFYGRSWYRLVHESKIGAVMASYNLIKGHKASENNDVLNGLLRGDMGHQGIIMSDWGAVWDSNKAAAAGLDLTMGAGIYRIPKDEVERQKLENLLNIMSKRILTQCFEFGFYDRGRKDQSFMNATGFEATALEAARESITLLRNRNGILPIPRGSNILVTGSAQQKTAGSGSGHVEGYDHQYTYEELCRRYGASNVKRVKNPSLADLNDASVVIAMIGTDDGEHGDRAFSLSSHHDAALMRKLAKTCPTKTVAVYFSGRGCQMDAWGDHVAGFIHAYYPGQSGGQAIAEVISGEVNPSGKLPYTMEYRFEDSPAKGYRPEGAGLSDQRKTEVDKNLPKFIPFDYSEGVFVGYRWYEKNNTPVRFPFGHGLSYTDFKYQNPKVHNSEKIIVSFELENIGSQKGAEVTQVYMTAPSSEVKRPLKELCGFSKQTLFAGESTTCKIEIHPEDLAYYNTQKKCWTVTPGQYTLSIGSSSDDIRLKTTFQIEREMNYQRPVPNME
jgi:beta-glucosidase